MTGLGETPVSHCRLCGSLAAAVNALGGEGQGGDGERFLQGSMVPGLLARLEATLEDESGAAAIGWVHFP